MDSSTWSFVYKLECKKNIEIQQKKEILQFVVITELIRAYAFIFICYTYAHIIGSMIFTANVQVVDTSNIKYDKCVD